MYLTTDGQLVIVWSHTVVPQFNITVELGTYISKPALSELVGQQFYDRYHCTFTTNGLPPGTYVVKNNGQPIGSVQVQNYAKRTSVFLDANTFPKIATLQGNVDVYLSPGLYTLSNVIALPSNCRIFGYGTTFRTALPRSTGHAYDQLFFHPPANNVEFHGIRFLISNNIFTGDGTQWNNIAFNDCTFQPATENIASVGRHRVGFFRNCLFDRVSVGLEGGFIISCRFQGMVHPRGDAHSLLIYGPNPAAIVRTVFDGTDRGPIFKNTFGTVEGILVSDITLTNINKVDNGNEIILFEADNSNAYQNNVLHRGRVFNCSGDINFWNANASNNSFNDWLLDDCTIYLPGYGLQTNNIFTNMEFRGGGVYFAGYATNNVVTNCAMINWRNTRRNQVQPVRYLYDTNAPRPDFRPLPVPNKPIYARELSAIPIQANIIEVQDATT